MNPTASSHTEGLPGSRHGRVTRYIAIHRAAGQREDGEGQGPPAKGQKGVLGRGRSIAMQKARMPGLRSDARTSCAAPPESPRGALVVFSTQQPFHPATAPSFSRRMPILSSVCPGGAVNHTALPRRPKKGHRTQAWLFMVFLPTDGNRWPELESRPDLGHPDPFSSDAGWRSTLSFFLPFVSAE